MYIASIVNHITNTADVIAAPSISVLITALAALTEKASAKSQKLDIVVTFGTREVDPGQIAGMVDDALTLSVVNRGKGHFYHNPLTAREAELISF
jgi:hypothetical protein